MGERGTRHHGALPPAGAHGIAGMEVNGYLAADRWHTTAAGTLVRMVGDAEPAAG